MQTETYKTVDGHEIRADVYNVDNGSDEVPTTVPPATATAAIAV